MALDSKLFGKWVLKAVDGARCERSNKETIKFKPNGILLYGFISEGKTQYAILTYDIQGDKIISDQPTAPRLEKSEYNLLDDNTLQLHYDNQISIFWKLTGAPLR